MKPNSSLSRICLLSLVVAACGEQSSDSGIPEESVDAGDDRIGDRTRYFPIEVGASWTYDVTKKTSVGSKVQSVLAYEDVGGLKTSTMAFKLKSEKPSGKYTISWQEDTGASLVRHREQTFSPEGTQLTEEFYVPGKLRLSETDEHLVLGSSFVSMYQEQIDDLVLGGGPKLFDKSETWTLEKENVEVTTAAGTFTCIQVRKTNAVTGSDKTYWFARGVGKVREQSATQTEELTGYNFP